MASKQSMKKGQIPVGCTLCESETKIQWKCIDCNLLMCSKCKNKVHSKFKNAADHKVIGIQELGQFEESTENLKFGDIKCQQHEGHDCCMFCKTCKHLICLKCITKIHHGHVFTDEEEYEVETKKLRDGQKKAQKNVDDLSDEEKKLEQLKTVNHTEYFRANKEILAQKNALKKAAGGYAEKFINELDQVWRNVTQSIDGRKNEVGLAKKQIEEQMGSADEILCSKDFATFFQNNERIGTALQGKADLTSQLVICMPKFIPKEITESTFGVLQVGKSSNDTRNIQMKVLNCYTIDIKYIHCIAICPDRSIWIGDNYSGDLQCIKTKADRVQTLAKKNRIQTLAKVNIKVFGIVTTTCNDLLLTFYRQSRLKKIINGTVDPVNSDFSVDPLIITAVHVTINNKVIIGARGGEKPFPATGKRVVIVMDKDGNHIAEYGRDCNKEHVFTYCHKITSTAKGNIGVLDRFNTEYHGRVVILGPQGEVINIYNGNNEINKEHIFSPKSIATTSLDNMIIVDLYCQVLHIINSDGQPITCYNPEDLGITCPYTLASSSTGHLYIGCNAKNINPQKLYKLEIKGF